LIHFDDAHFDAAWATERRTQLATKLANRLAALSDWLGDGDFLEERFSAGDLIMVTVLRELVDCGALSQFANLDEYRRRCEARPAFHRALEAQMEAFREDA
jgi:glutathione S-transferase